MTRISIVEDDASLRTVIRMVLEKAGYVLEGRLRRSAVKDGVITDQLQYAFNP